MNLKKYVYVSPQYHIKHINEWCYEYIIDGIYHRSASFPPRQGKDIFKKIELHAWRINKEVRKLSEIEWRTLRFTLLGSTYRAEDGSTIIFHTRSQYRKFIREMETPNALVVPLRQLPTGEIILQQIYEDEGRYGGFLIFIGLRGGIRTEHGFHVIKEGDQFELLRSGQLSLVEQPE
jgi:hypothetical protein